MKQKGIRITLWSVGACILMGIMMISFSIKLGEAVSCIGDQAAVEESRRLCEQNSRAFADGSDFLTNEVWHFVATQDMMHLQSYWNEVENIRSRENAVEKLYSYSLTDEEQELIEQAMQASNQLIFGEAWAMRLVVDSLGIPVSQMPERVAAVVYENGEEKLSPFEKQQLASGYIFGRDYSASKADIKNSIRSFRTLLQERKNRELEQAVFRTREALHTVRGLMYAMILTFLVIAFMFYIFIIRPVYHYTRSLEQMDGRDYKAIRPMGFQEIKAFGMAFNRIYGEWQRQKERLEKERYRFHVALENTSILVYEYDIRKDTFTTFGSLEETDAAADSLQEERVYGEFIQKYADAFMGAAGVEYFNRILKGVHTSNAELKVRLSNGDDRMIWARMSGTPVFDEEHRMVKIIGKISDIQSEKEKECALEDIRSRDGLTGLYKHDIGIRKVRKYMKEKPEEEICSLMLLDMDNFAAVNEAEGQAFADAILQDVADILREQTGQEDILIRLGGDEFMVFLKDCPRTRTMALGSKIAGLIRSLSDQQPSKLRLSASIGMCATEVVDEYSGLYRCAESTLNYVKENEKGQAVCYLEASNELGMMLTQIYPESHLINKIDREERISEDILSLALELLGKSKNLDDALFLLLFRVGKNCALDRVQIIENNIEYLNCRVAYQWCRNASDRNPSEPVYVSREDLQSITDSFDEEGLSERRVLSTLCDMPSLLYAGTYNYGQCVGAISFERRAKQEWTAQERQLLSELTKIISSFTLKARADATSQAKTDFLSRMSHEIRTPMNAISGMTTIAKAVQGNPPKTLECLNKIETSNRYLLGLINDVLDMSRIESGKVELHLTELSIVKLIENLENLIRPQAEAAHLAFTIENDFKGNAWILADELRLNQILINLLGNAVKFTHEGKVSLQITTVEATQKSAALRFLVSDTGIGIHEEALGRIFNAFEQEGSVTNSEYGGTGLGLAVSSRLVQLMGGSLEVKSERGIGSDFYFTLNFQVIPKLEESEQEHDDSEVEEVLFIGKRVLLVEDNDLNREIAQEILKMHGFIIECAGNGKEALTMFTCHEPGYYDAILMDIRMPVMDGMEATRLIRTIGRPDSRRIPIIAMTANAFDEDMQNSLDNGMDGHLSKPIDVEVLLRTLRRLLTDRARQA